MKLTDVKKVIPHRYRFKIREFFVRLSQKHIKRKALQNIINELKDTEKEVKAYLETKQFCPICNSYGHFYPWYGDVNPRFLYICPTCLSASRHRFLYYVYKNVLSNIKQNIKILHMAPEKCFKDLWKNPLIDYTAMDLSPEAYDFVKCKRENVLNLSFKDNSFDVVLSNHVIEHVEDENKFMSEVLRVLKPGGKLLLNIPIYFDTQKSFENPDIVTREDRRKFYGDSDHCRKYGTDVIEKFKNFYNAECIEAKDIISFSELKSMNVDFCETVFFITK